MSSAAPSRTCDTVRHACTPGKVTATQVVAGALAQLDASAGCESARPRGYRRPFRSGLTGCSAAVAWVPMGFGQTRDAESSGGPPDG